MSLLPETSESESSDDERKLMNPTADRVVHIFFGNLPDYLDPELLVYTGRPGESFTLYRPDSSLKKV